MMMKRQAHKPARAIALAAMALPLASCVTVSPPDKPIEINLNVTIRQEVLVALRPDVQQLMRENPDTFPQKPQ